MLLTDSLRSLSIGLTLAAALLAQGADVARASFGVSVRAGEVRAGGPDYAARFDGRGVEFVPALGREAPQAYPVRFTLESVRRGSVTVFARSQDVVPAVDGNAVRYVHGADLTEVYDARIDGIEQSFVFARKPVGDGDLVVRGAIATELPLAAAGNDGVRYELPGLGGVTFGSVTGVDANGATAHGSIRSDRDPVAGYWVEWVLPAAFVENAQYPLVLDPLIGATFVVSTVGQPDSDPRVAFDATTSRYLVVWKVAVSATDDEVRGRLVGSTGTLLGSLLVFSSTTLVHGGPAVANVNATGRFLVTWADSYGASPFSLSISRVLMASVGAGTGAVSSTVLVATAPLHQIDSPRVGGDSRPTGVANEYACIVYRRLSAGQQRLESRGVHVIAAADPVMVGVANVVTTGIVADPSITKHAGTAGNWIAAWVHGGGLSGPHQDVSCIAIGAFGVPCSAVKVVSIGVASSNVERTSCATSDGHDFVVAWEDEVADRVRVRPFSFTGACPGTFSSGLQVAPIATPGNQHAPAIEFAKDKYMLAWLNDAAGSTSLYVKGLQPATCASCGVETLVDGSGTPRVPDVVSHWSGGDTASDEALVVWANGTILGRRWEAVGTDIVASMGGGCGISGFTDYATYNNDAVIGAANFELVLFAPTAPVVALIVGFTNISVPCGSCTLVPSLDILLPGVSPNHLAIPCDPLLVGVDIYTQWLLLKPSDCPVLPDFAFSNALRFTIGE